MWDAARQTRSGVDTVSYALADRNRQEIRDRADDSWPFAVLREILLQCDDGVSKLPNT